MNHLLFVLIAFVFSAVIGISSADAAFDMFLKVETINGESTDSDHKDWIDVLSWEWGASSELVSGGGARDIFKVKFFDVIVTKEVDRSSPKLFLAVAKGTLIPKATVDITETFDGVQESLINYELSDVVVSQYSISGAKFNPTLDEIGLRFNKVQMTYNQLNSDGTPRGSSTVTWDLEGNAGGEVEPVPPPVSVQSLIDELGVFVAAGKIDSRTGTSLKWLLDAALAAENGNDDPTSILKLQSFVSRVDLFKTRGVIPADVGQALLDSADVIIKGKKILEN